ncbi:MAG: hypothetical protein ACOYOU_07020 [Kiritimatiellia bacterium]
MSYGLPRIVADFLCRIEKAFFFAVIPFRPRRPCAAGAKDARETLDSGWN